MGQAKAPRRYALRLRREAVGHALQDGFRAGRLPPVPEVAARVYASSDEAQRASLLGLLLKSVGPLALGVLAAGQFARHMHRERWTTVALSLDEIRRVSADQVAEIARYVEQANPDAVRAISDWIAAHPASLAVLGASAIATLVNFAIARHRAPQEARSARDADVDWLDE